MVGYISPSTLRDQHVTKPNSLFDRQKRSEHAAQSYSTTRNRAQFHFSTSTPKIRSIRSSTLIHDVETGERISL